MKKTKVPHGKCINCKNAKLMQWFNNPVISECTITKRREVASFERYCEFYICSDKELPIEHFDKYEKR